VTTISQAAVHIGVSTDTIRRRIRSGQLKAEKVGGMWSVEVPETAQDGPRIAGDGLERLVLVLEAQLEAKDQQILQLHQILATRQLTGQADRTRWWQFFWR